MILRLLAGCGRHGTALLAGGFFIGLVFPPLAALFHPLLGTFVFLLTAATMLSVDWRIVAQHVRRPLKPLLILAWTMVGAPILTAGAVAIAGAPGPLGKALVVWAASPPLISVPAIALLLGLDSALALLIMVAGTLLTPFTLPPLVLGLIGVSLDIGMAKLMANLGLFTLGAALAAAVLRRFLGPDRVARHALELSGVTVIFLLLFGVAVMDGMTALLLARPGLVLGYAAAAVVVSVLLQGVSFIVFHRLERRTALTAGLIGGNHNMAVVWASLGPAAAAELALFFAVVQFQIFVLPAVLRPIYQRFSAREPLKPKNTSPGGG